jgi:hypothetical protein
MYRRARRAGGFEALQTVLVVAVAAALLLALKLAWASDVRPAVRDAVARVLGPVEAGVTEPK